MLYHFKVLGPNNNKLGEDAAKHIAGIISSNTGLEKLYLSNNKLKGVGVKQIGRILVQHVYLRNLKLEMQ